MDFTGYGGEIQRLVKEIEECRYRRNGTYMEDCRKLIKIGKEREDSYLLGFACYYLAEGYFCFNDHQNMINSLTEAIVNQREASQWRLLVRSHNAMGIDAVSRGNATVALDQYITALSYGKKYDYPYETAIVNSNVGRLYMSFGEYESAVHYLKKASQTFWDYRDDFFGKINLATTYASLGRCSLCRNNLKEAMEYEEKIYQAGTGREAEFDYFMTRGLFARIRHEQGRWQERDQYIENIAQNLKGFQTLLDSQEDVFDFLDFLLEIGKYQELEKIFPKLELMAEESGITNLKIELLRRQAEYYRAVQDRENYLEICARLYEEQEILKEEGVSVFHRATELRFSLERARKKEKELLREKQILKERSEKDELTGLANRYKLNDYAGKIFDRARERHDLLSIEIFDVDYFKQYNDTYGHQAGDGCLKEIGNILDELMQRDKDIFCARYGGDEFIVIYYGKSDEEILKLAKELRQRVLDLQLENKESQESEYVTISQGIRSSIPRHQHRMWDYLSGADQALYRVKKKKKNSICLIHKNEDSAESVIV